MMTGKASKNVEKSGAAQNEGPYDKFKTYQSLDEICEALRETLREQHDLQLKTNYAIRLENLISDMNMILAAGGLPPVSSRTVTSIFKMQRLKSVDKNSRYFRSADYDRSEISRKYPSNRFYVERRYWGQEETIAFCIAARLSEEMAEQVAESMMGQPWSYLRDPYTLVTDYAISNSLTPEQTASLLSDTQEALHQYQQENQLELELQADPEALTAKLTNCYEEELKSRRFATTEEAIRQFREFVRLEGENLVGSFSRTIYMMQKLVRFEGWTDKGLFPPEVFRPFWGYPADGRDELFRTRWELVTDPRFGASFEQKVSPDKRETKKCDSDERIQCQWSLRHLAKELAQTFVPWEAKWKQPTASDGKWRLLETGVNKEGIVYERLRYYLNPPASWEICYAQMRMDVIRLLLIYEKSDISYINRHLRSLSFSTLNAALPFDFFVLAAISSPWGKKAGSEKKPYEALKKLMAYYAETDVGEENESES